MKNAVVIGATSHVGLAVCQELIAKEVEVTGFERLERMDASAEERLMGIGRNAFFHMNRNQNADETSYETAFYFVDENTKEDNEIIDAYLENSSKLLIISKYSRKNLERKILQEKNIKKPNCSIYLPEIYEPLETDVSSDLELEEKYETIYVENAAAAICKIAQETLESKQYLLLPLTYKKK
ncbi:hypothetical protein FIU87_06870 [Bacillus sp. THAF10]|nr:hypothetical protein FIU87_06870 [Bacillus sp. THAF10]